MFTPFSTGSFMILSASPNINISSTARLISYPQPADQDICVSFYYHIFGSSIGMWFSGHNFQTKMQMFFLSAYMFLKHLTDIILLPLSGSLKFIAKRSGEPETVVWVRSGTQGNKWRFADLTFSSGKPIQVG